MRALLAFVALSPLASTSAFGFSRSNVLAAGGGLRSISHQRMTEDELKSCLKAGGIAKPSPSSLKAIAEIVDANSKVDDNANQKFAEFHCDGESFPEAQQRIVGLLKEVKQRLEAKDGKGAREALGGALHTLQDFYSHSNWVELGNTKTLRDMMMASPVVQRAEASVATCRNPCTDSCKCTKNPNALSTLTSGYYPKQNREKPNDGKCLHGGLLAGTSDGINKDVTSCRWSPHGDYHLDAAHLAQVATGELLTYLKQQLTDKQIRLLLGIGPTVTFLIDTTKEFQLLSQLGTKGFVQAILHDDYDEGNEPSQYVLVTFDHTGVKSTLVTDDVAEIEEASNAITSTTETYSCSDTPTLSTIRSALNTVGGGGELFLWTNTAPTDGELTESVSALAAEKGIRVWTFLWDQQGILSCTKHPDNAQFKQLAATTGGEAFYPTKDDAMAAAQLVFDAMHRAGGDIGAGSGTFDGTGSTTSALTVDDTVTTLTLSSVGATELKIFRPGGAEVVSTDTGVLLSNGGARHFAQVQNPGAGVWTLKLSGSGEYAFRARAATGAMIERVSFVEVSGRPDHEGYFSIPGAPPAGAIATLSVTVSTGLTAPTLELHDAEGRLLLTATPELATEAFGSDLIAQLTVPVVPFRVEVVATTTAGSSVRRVAPELIEPRTVTLNRPMIEDPIAVDSEALIPFVVTNHGADGSFAVLPTDDLGYVRGVEPVSLPLARGESKTVNVRVRPTGDVPSRESIRLAVTGSSRSASNHATADIRIAQKSGKGGCGCSTPSGLTVLAALLVLRNLSRRSRQQA